MLKLLFVDMSISFSLCYLFIKELFSLRNFSMRLVFLILYVMLMCWLQCAFVKITVLFDLSAVVTIMSGLFLFGFLL